MRESVRELSGRIYTIGSPSSRFGCPRSVSVARTFPLSPAIYSANWLDPWAKRSAILTKRRWGPLCPIPGPGMGGNSATSWSGWSCSRPTALFGGEMSEARFHRVGRESRISRPESGQPSIHWRRRSERSKQFTKSYLRAKLAQHGGVITKAAEDSGIPRQHFSLLMKRFLGSERVENP